MLFYFLRRELLDHLLSLRFVLAMLLSIGLMTLNGVTFSGGKFQERINRYIANQQRADELLSERAEDLAMLGVRGPGSLYKKPSQLVFCASGRDDFLPARIMANSQSSQSGSWGQITLWAPWILHYDQLSEPPLSGIVSDFIDIDWVFIIGFIFSLMAVLFTFDGICGERQTGTLQLVLSGAVPRSAVLGGKFLSVLLILFVPLAIGTLVDLLIAGLFGPISFTLEILGKIAAIFVAALLYLAFFVGLGLAVSSRCARSSSSLVFLVLIWGVLVILIPNTTPGMLAPLETPTFDWQTREKKIEDLREKYAIHELVNTNPDGRPPVELVAALSAFTEEWRRFDESFQDREFERNWQQVEQSRRLNRVTPYGLFQDVLESLADTGSARHHRFVQAARAYRTTFRRFIQAEDARDPDSYHLPGLLEGLSRREVPPEAVPRFSEDLSAQATILSTLSGLLLLALFALIAFMAAHLAFLRARIA